MIYETGWKHWCTKCFILGLLSLMPFLLLFSDILWILSGTPGLRAHISCLRWPDCLHTPVQTWLQQARSWVLLSLQLTFDSLSISQVFKLLPKSAVLLTRLFAGLWILIIASFMRVSAHSLVSLLSERLKQSNLWSSWTQFSRVFSNCLLDFLPQWHGGVGVCRRRRAAVLWLHHLRHTHPDAQAVTRGAHTGLHQPLPRHSQPLPAHPAHPRLHEEELRRTCMLVLLYAGAGDVCVARSLGKMMNYIHEIFVYRYF